MQFVCTKCKRDVDTPGLFCPYCGTPAPQPGAEPEDPYVGRTIAGKYFVNQRLGRGGMGEVYKATHLTLDRPVALKVLHRSLLADPSMVQRFHREARAASRLSHPNCINVLDFGEEDGTLYIAMEYLGGRSLSKLLADDFPLSQGRVVRIMAQILSALAEAHAAGIIHRDLKLTNVMVEVRREEPDFVKVLDFGIAKLAEPGEARSQLTGTGIVCGTPGYMSPEQALGEQLDARSDLYAAGVVLYELLTGRLPFESETPMGLVAKHMAETPVSPRARRPDLDLSPDLDALVMRALEKDRAARPQTAEEMREELLAAHLPPERDRPSTPKPERSSTVFIPAAREASPRPARPATPARPPAAAAPDAGAPAPRTPAPRTPAPQPRAQVPRTPAPQPRTPAPRTPPPPAPDARADRDDPDREEEGAPPVSPGGRAPHRRAARPSRRLAAAVAGAGVVVVAIAGYALFGRDPFSAPATKPAAAPDADLVLKPSRPQQPGSTGTEEHKVAAAPAVEPGGGPKPPEVTGVPQVAPGPVPQRPEAQVAPGPQAKPEPQARPEPPARPEAQAKPEARPSPPAPPKPSAAPPRPAAKKGAGVRQVAEGLGVLPVPAASSGDGLLVLTASPWAVAYVDGREIGETPRELRVGEGFYRVRLEHPTLGRRETTMTVPAGRRATYNVNLAQ